MGIATKQLETIFKEINDRFETHRYISIKPGDGDPPERYDVTYHITGLHQNKNKEVHEAKHHSITITIPFGFPHFPPNCKPISPIFHPDFDQAAICIGDFWNKESTLPDLIFHIGQMISGEVFSTDNAFNEEAVIWYRQHNDRLPFEVLDLSNGFSSSVVPVHEEDSFTALESLEIDTIEESDFKSDFDSFPPGIDTAPQEKSSQAMEVDVDLLQLMVKQKRFYTLYKHLQTIPADKQFNNFDELKNTAYLELTKAKQLFQQGLDFEHKGQPGKALEKFQLLTASVSDYPEIEESLNRAKSASNLLYDYHEESENKPKSESLQEIDFSSKSIPKAEKLTFFNEKPETRFPVLPIVIAGASVILLSLVIFFLSSNNSQFKQAEDMYSTCQALLQKNNFIGAEQKCNEALSTVKSIQFLKGKERAALANTIQTTLNSPKLRQGLAGMVLRNGQYVPKGDEDALIAFNKASDEGDTFMANLSWKEAKDRYQQAITIHSKIGTIDTSALEKIGRLKKNIALAQVNLLVEEGKQLKESGDLEKALITLEKAQETAKSLDNAVMPATIKSIEPLLFVTRFLKSKKVGDTYFAAGDWQNAAELYQKATDTIKNIQAPPTAELTELNQNKAKADLFAAIKNGKDAFNNAQWDDAIRSYESAIRLLKENSEILKQVSSDENRQKISRIMLQASIIRDKQDVARKLKEGKNKQAIDKLQSIIDTVTKSSFNREEEFQQVVNEAHLSVAEAKKNQLISEGVAYLVENYKDIFLKNYSAAKSDSLSDPKATFVKKLDERLLFKIECTDNGQRNPLRLIMNYIYDPASKKWQFYSDTQ
jgi:ubiquitin-protein ligase